MSDGPWLMVQLLARPTASRAGRYPGAVRQALMTCEIDVGDVHCAVEDHDALVAQVPGLDAGSLVVNRVGELVADLLRLDRAEVRLGVYPTLSAAHRAAGDPA